MQLLSVAVVRVTSAAVLYLVAHALPIHAQSLDTLASRTLAAGVVYHQFADPHGPWIVSVVRVDLRRADIALRQTRAYDSLRARERTSSMARRIARPGLEVLAAVNADFFDVVSGESENNQVIDGEWWKGLKVTDSPYDTFDNVHAQFAIDSAHRPSIDRYLFDGRFWAKTRMTPIITLNAIPSGTHEGAALFTPRYGTATPRDTTRRTVEAPLTEAGVRGDTAIYVRRGALAEASGTPIPRGGAVLTAHGPRAEAVRAMAEGDTVRVLLATLPRLARGRVPTLLIGGWPRILHDGRNVAGESAIVEGTISRNAEVRHPRTAIGYSRDGRVLWLLVVDGRSARSAGMTLVELADQMRRLGAWQALNFDGGGSTTMVIGGVVVNSPSDATGERTVGNALLVLRKAP